MKQTMFGIMGVAEVVTAAVCQAVLETFGKVIQASELKLGTPPKKEMGDVAITCHSLAKVLKKNPAQIASQLATAISAEGIFQEVKAVGAYLNFVLAPGPVVQTVVSQIRQQGKTYGQCSTGQGKRVMIEYGGPNTNKALHIGHLRNHQIGIALINILNAVGYQVIPVGIINDRGIMICQSMVGYMLWGEGKTPQSTGIKGDHFVGKYYAQYRAAVTAELEVWLQGQGIELEQYNALLDSDDQQGKELKKKFEAQSKLVQQAYDLLRQWEAGDSETRQLWATMNEWVISAFQPTYQRQGVHFQRVWLESETYKCGKETILAQLEKGVVAYGTQGNIFIDLNDVDLKEPTLLRSDGTTVYLTQDIATAEQRFTEYAPLDQLIYVVACEQQYHFRALFETLKRFGFEWAQKCYHLSYGMVKMAGGKVSSRKIKKGGVFLADDLMDHLHELARQAILERDSEASGPELEHRAELIGLAALKYWLAKTNPDNDVIFDPEESLRFEGNTGPYLLYTYARAMSILNRAGELSEQPLPLYSSSEELELAKALATYPEKVESAAAGYNPSLVASQVYEIARAFSQWYASSNILGESQVDLRNARLHLVAATVAALKNGLTLLGIDALEKM